MKEKQWADRKEKWRAQDDDARKFYDVDFARIIHSASFRRLQGKTQILNLGDSDFYRTRLTHSIEVSQIAMGIVKQIQKAKHKHDALKYLPHEKLVAAIGATHDLGHPPFGHGGEVALNYCMRNAGGFEGNAQTLRILSKLERFSQESGANLSRITLLGCLKYPCKFSDLKNPVVEPRKIQGKESTPLIDRASCKPPKCYFDEENDIIDWLLEPFADKDKTEFTSFECYQNKHHKTKHHSFDCSIMNLADDISYGVHDFEDSLALNLVDGEAIETDIGEADFSHFLDDQKERYQEEKIEKKVFIDNLLGPDRKRYIGRLIHYSLTNIDILEKDFDNPLLKYRVTIKKEAQQLLDALKKLVRKEVIYSPNVQQLEFKG